MDIYLTPEDAEHEKKNKHTERSTNSRETRSLHQRRSSKAVIRAAEGGNLILELPISLKIANAKGKILSAVNLASVEYNLPAFILEGILSDILSDTRAQARIEALNDVNSILEEKNKNDQEDEE